MSDQLHEVKMSTPEQMDTAKNLLLNQATEHMFGGFLPDHGQGTVHLDKQGNQRIVGLNDGFSRIHWVEQTTRSENFTKTIDSTAFGDKKPVTIHTEIWDAREPKTSKDNFTVLGDDGKPKFEMKGKCEITADGARDCTYDLSSKTDGTGTAHITTKRVEENPKAKAWSAQSEIDVKTSDFQMKAELNYHVSDNVATYDYKKK